jgi:hypothetical protein
MTEKYEKKSGKHERVEKDGAQWKFIRTAEHNELH